MGRLAGHLRFFFRKKMSEDPAWQKPTIIFSGLTPFAALQAGLEQNLLQSSFPFS